jgi:hypothetical protein
VDIPRILDYLVDWVTVRPAGWPGSTEAPGQRAAGRPATLLDIAPADVGDAGASQGSAVRIKFGDHKGGLQLPAPGGRRDWPPSTPFGEVVCYLPQPCWLCGCSRRTPWACSRERTAPGLAGPGVDGERALGGDQYAPPGELE